MHLQPLLLGLGATICWVPAGVTAIAAMATPWAPKYLVLGSLSLGLDSSLSLRLDSSLSLRLDSSCWLLPHFSGLCISLILIWSCIATASAFAPSPAFACALLLLQITSHHELVGFLLILLRVPPLSPLSCCQALRLVGHELGKTFSNEVTNGCGPELGPEACSGSVSSHSWRCCSCHSWRCCSCRSYC